MNQTDLAWAAGFHEGEGHISRPKAGGLIATISQTDPEPLHRLKSMFGGSVYGPKIIVGGNRPVWIWSINNARGTMDYVYGILPWLSERKAEDCLSKVEYWITKQEVRRAFCTKGHYKPLAGSRTSGSGRGTICKTCESCRKKDYYERKMER